MTPWRTAGVLQPLVAHVVVEDLGDAGPRRRRRSSSARLRAAPRSRRGSRTRGPRCRGRRCAGGGGSRRRGARTPSSPCGPCSLTPRAVRSAFRAVVVEPLAEEVPSSNGTHRLGSVTLKLQAAPSEVQLFDDELVEQADHVAHGLISSPGRETGARACTRPGCSRRSSTSTGGRRGRGEAAAARPLCPPPTTTTSQGGRRGRGSVRARILAQWAGDGVPWGDLPGDGVDDDVPAGMAMTGLHSSSARPSAACAMAAIAGAAAGRFSAARQRPGGDPSSAGQRYDRDAGDPRL